MPCTNEYDPTTVLTQGQGNCKDRMDKLRADRAKRVAAAEKARQDEKERVENEKQQRMIEAEKMRLEQLETQLQDLQHKAAERTIEKQQDTHKYQTPAKHQYFFMTISEDDLQMPVESFQKELPQMMENFGEIDDEAAAKQVEETVKQQQGNGEANGFGAMSLTDETNQVSMKLTEDNQRSPFYDEKTKKENRLSKKLLTNSPVEEQLSKNAKKKSMLLSSIQNWKSKQQSASQVAPTVNKNMDTEVNPDKVSDSKKNSNANEGDSAKEKENAAQSKTVKGKQRQSLYKSFVQQSTSRQQSVYQEESSKTETKQTNLDEHLNLNESNGREDNSAEEKKSRNTTQSITILQRLKKMFFTK